MASITRMTPCSYVLLAVLTRLQNVAIPGIKSEEITILPEGHAPPSMGERYLVISPESDVTTTGNADFRGSIIYFKVNLIQRMRSIPNDRQGILYTNDNELHDTHETIKDAIQSIELVVQLHALIARIELANEALLIASPGTQVQKRYSAARSFIHKVTTLNPIHLYPGWFNTRPSSENEKIAGYLTYQSFQSPTFYPIVNPLTCS